MASVFIIDDDPLFAKLVRTTLQAHGYEIDWNNGAFGALTKVRNGDYSVILVDVQMPDIEGTKIVDVLRARGIGGAKIVLMSSIPEPQLVARAQKAGADAYFQKGRNLDQLVAILARFCRTDASSSTLSESLGVHRRR
jgi:DNA-binding response OmpR family regulator